MTTQEIKSEIRRYRRLKLKCRAGSVERLDLEHRIKELKSQLESLLIVDKEKKPIIQEIMKYEKCSLFDETYYNKFAVGDLKKHLENLKRRG